MPAPGIRFVELPEAHDVVAVRNRRPLQAVDVATHRRNGVGVAGCGMPAKQDQLVDTGWSCREPGCGRG